MKPGRCAAAVMLAIAVGCAPAPPGEEELAAVNAQAAEIAESLTASEADDGGGVVVRLAFDRGVDLDLYVTDPLLDTVYFARHESSTGGVISRDVRCDTPGEEAIRVEEVRFLDSWPGRYRVGVDFPRRCGESRSRLPAAYAVSVSANGRRYQAQGLVNQEFFEVVVLEFEVAEGEG